MHRKDCPTKPDEWAVIHGLKIVDVITSEDLIAVSQKSCADKTCVADFTALVMTEVELKQEFLSSTESGRREEILEQLSASRPRYVTVQGTYD